MKLVTQLTLLSVSKGNIKSSNSPTPNIDLSTKKQKKNVASESDLS